MLGLHQSCKTMRDCSAVVERERRKKPNQLLDGTTQKQKKKIRQKVGQPNICLRKREKEGGKERGGTGRGGLGGRKKDGKTERSRKREKNNM